jgi:hypothetical protein
MTLREFSIFCFAACIVHAFASTSAVADGIRVHVAVRDAEKNALAGIAVVAMTGGPTARGVTGPDGNVLLELDPPPQCERVYVAVSDAFDWPEMPGVDLERLRARMSVSTKDTLFPRARWIEISRDVVEYKVLLQCYPAIMAFGEFRLPGGIAPPAYITSMGLVRGREIPDPGTESFSIDMIPQAKEQVLLFHFDRHHYVYAHYLSQDETLRDIDLEVLQIQPAGGFGSLDGAITSVDEWSNRYLGLYEPGLTLVSTRVATDHTAYDLVAEVFDGAWRLKVWGGEVQPIQIRVGEYFVLPGMLMRTGAQDRVFRLLMGPEETSPPVPVVRIQAGEGTTVMFDLIELDDALRAAGYYEAESDF